MNRAIVRFLLPVAFLIAAPAMHAADLSEVNTLARTGATGLALELMDRHQPDAAEDPVAWMQWERERMFLYRTRRHWDAIVERAGAVPDNIHPGFERWARHQKARAQLEMGAFAESRRTLASLIWEGEAVEADRLEEWRRMIVESWLDEGEAEAARSALRRLRQDFPDDGADARLMEARLYLLEERGEEALGMLEGLLGDEYRNYRLLARLLEDPDQAGEILNEGIGMGFDQEIDVEQRRTGWAVAARAAEKAGNRTARVATLERALSYGERDGATGDPLFSVEADALWDAYEVLGRALGNEARILVGDEEAWYEAAERAAGSESVHARAMYAVMTGRDFDAEVREQAHKILADMLVRENFGEPLLRNLYLTSERYPDPGDIPRPVRYHLADIVLDEGDIPLASRIMEGLEKPPEGVAPEDWQLRRARVLLLGGARAEGLEALWSVMEESEELNVDRFLQVVFDLQDMGDHEPALEFLEAIELDELADQTQREILFWRAESVESLGDPVEAARLYLRSAGHVDAFSMDQWAQTARYRAADALAEAGETEDARRLYRSLLNATQDEARRAVLRNRLERLERRPQEAVEPEGAEMLDDPADFPDG